MGSKVCQLHQRCYKAPPPGLGPVLQVGLAPWAPMLVSCISAAMTWHIQGLVLVLSVNLALWGSNARELHQQRMRRHLQALALVSQVSLASWPPTLVNSNRCCKPP